MSLQVNSLFSGPQSNEGSRPKYLAIHSSNFKTTFPALDLVTQNAVTLTLVTKSAGSALFIGQVLLPHKATILRGIIYGDAVGLANRYWAMIRVRMTTAASNTIFGAAPGVLCNNWAVAAQDYADVDNENYAYVLYVVQPLDGDILYGAHIEYTI